MVIDPISGADEGLRTALTEAGLPTDDLTGAGRKFYRFRDPAGLAGYAGLEGDGPDRLLRSFVVVAGRRRQGVGREIHGVLEWIAGGAGVHRLHVLTTDAAAFFQSLGYRSEPRQFAPAEIAATAEFSRLCPESATYLVRRL